VLLGIFSDVAYTVTERVLSEGDLLCLYTDGVTEARDSHGEEFGVGQLADILKRHRGEAAAAAGRAILHPVEAFSGKERPDDDVTLVILRVGALSIPHRACRAPACKPPGGSPHSAGTLRESSLRPASA